MNCLGLRRKGCYSFTREEEFSFLEPGSYVYVETHQEHCDIWSHGGLWKPLRSQCCPCLGWPSLLVRWLHNTNAISALKSWACCPPTDAFEINSEPRIIPVVSVEIRVTYTYYTKQYTGIWSRSSGVLYGIIMLLRLLLQPSSHGDYMDICISLNLPKINKFYCM